MANFLIEIADEDEQTVIDALAFNGGYNEAVDGDKRTFAVAYVIDYINSVVKVVAEYNIRTSTEATIKQAISEIKQVSISNPEAVEFVKPVEESVASVEPVEG